MGIKRRNRKITAKTSISVLLMPVLLMACEPRSKKDERTLSFLKQGYNKNTLYVYTVSIYDSTTLTARDTLGLFCSDVKMHNGQYMMQWNSIKKTGHGYQLADKAHSSFTGIEVSDTQLYIHPPREGAYRILQFCPHPLLCLPGFTPKQWTHELTIGSLWRTEPRFDIDSGTSDTFTSKYFIVDSNTSERFVVTALTLSKFGITAARYDYSNDSGLVYFEMIPDSDVRYEFTLIDIARGIEGLRFNKNLTYYIERKRQAREGLPFNISNEVN